MKARHRLPKNYLRSICRNSRSGKLLITLMLLVLIKIIYFISFAWEQRTPFSINEFFNSDVAAQEDKAAPQAAAEPARRPETDNETKKWDASDDFKWSYELIKALQQREARIRMKQADLAKEEERLLAIKKEIEQKIELVSKLSKKVAALIEIKKAADNEKLVKLAKVFEATPPEQAGPLLSKLDIDIAAQMILKMSSRKAGRIWGFVVPEKAVQISKELARIKPSFDINKMSVK